MRLCWIKAFIQAELKVNRSEASMKSFWRPGKTYFAVCNSMYHQHKRFPPAQDGIHWDPYNVLQGHGGVLTGSVSASGAEVTCLRRSADRSCMDGNFAEQAGYGAVVLLCSGICLQMATEPWCNLVILCSRSILGKKLGLPGKAELSGQISPSDGSEFVSYMVECVEVLQLEETWNFWKPHHQQVVSDATLATTGCRCAAVITCQSASYELLDQKWKMDWVYMVPRHVELDI